MAEKEYIERDGVVGKLIERKYCSTSSKIDYGEVIRLLNSEPVADVQEVRHGKWIISSDGYYPYCSECWKEPKEISEFCPHCGAKMDRGEQNVL